MATVPGRQRWGFFTVPEPCPLLGHARGALFLAPFVANCLRGAFPPADLRAVCLVRSMVGVGESSDILVDGRSGCAFQLGFCGCDEGKTGKRGVVEGCGLDATNTPKKSSDFIEGSLFN